MLKKHFLSLTSLLTLAFLCVSCETWYFAADPRDYRLPAPTEQGVGIAAALINGDAWRQKIQVSGGLFSQPYVVPFLRLYPDSTFREVPLFGSIISPTTSFAFGGEIFEYVPEIKAEDLTSIGYCGLRFTLANPYPQKTADLTALQGKKFVIDNKTNFARVDYSKDQKTSSCYASTGEIYFSKAALTKKDTAILAGTFKLTVNTCRGIEIKAGRFDYFCANIP